MEKITSVDVIHNDAADPKGLEHAMEMMDDNDQNWINTAELMAPLSPKEAADKGLQWQPWRTAFGLSMEPIK